MPKVNEAHFEKKKNEIIEAAIRLCLRKPIYIISMRDIVIEAGMSQGGVYKYFSNIDEVFVALLNKNTYSHDLEEQIDALFKGQKPPHEGLGDFFSFIALYIQFTVKGNEKMFLELPILYANEPERFLRIKEQIIQIPALEYIQNRLVEFIKTHVELGDFKPIVPLEDIFTLIMSTINGIANEALMAHNFRSDLNNMPKKDFDKIKNTLMLAVSYLLGVENERI